VVEDGDAAQLSGVFYRSVYVVAAGEGPSVEGEGAWGVDPPPRCPAKSEATVEQPVFVGEERSAPAEVFGERGETVGG